MIKLNIMIKLYFNIYDKTNTTLTNYYNTIFYLHSIKKMKKNTFLKFG